MVPPLSSLVEDPSRFEAAVRSEVLRAGHDDDARAVLESIYAEEDREAAFARFRGGVEWARLRRLLGALGVDGGARVCEVGGGSGFLSWALHTSGFAHVDLVEPSEAFVTGTGYLRTRADARGIRVWNDLGAFHADPGRYDLLLTRNCVHHFQNIAFAAACLRGKLVPGGRWLMVREWYAETPRQVYAALREHPYALRYGLFEFPYSVRHYVSCVTAVGFTLGAVVPGRYGGGALETYAATEGGTLARAWTVLADAVLRAAPRLTVAAYLAELPLRRLPPRLRFFTRPAALLFRRAEVAGAD